MTQGCEILPGEQGASIDRAAEVLRGGGLVGMPTETVYGLAANALDPVAVAQVFEAKGRPSFDPLIVHVPDRGRAAALAGFNEVAGRLAEAFWPGPMTLVLPRRRGAAGEPIVPDLVTAGLDTVAVRVPSHPVARALLERAGLPLAAPSANRFGSISPTRAQHVADELGVRIGLVLDGGPCARGVESTVLRVVGPQVEVLRLGSLALEAIERLIGRPLVVREPSSSPGMDAQASTRPLPAPGLTKRHYAPRTPMRLVASPDVIPEADPSRRAAILGVGVLPEGLPGYSVVRSLSVSGDLAEAASVLFQALRELDVMGLDEIVAVRAPGEGLGRAINDRLERGSA